VQLFVVAGAKYEEWWKKWSRVLYEQGEIIATRKCIFLSDDNLQIGTCFLRLPGKPPIMVAGMTPSTAKAGFISAALGAGCHIELTRCNAAALQIKVAEIQKQTPAGADITLSSLYTNPRQFALQLPLWQEMLVTKPPGRLPM